MARTVRLRPWQHHALDALAAAGRSDFLAVATPGAGKTTFALTAARRYLADRRARVVVVAPTQHLKHQWAAAAHQFALHLEPEWTASAGRLPADMHGVVTTYQQVATSARSLRSVAAGAFVVFDEIHHAADDRAWGDAIREAFEGAGQRLALSGTPFRSDTRSIPFVRYEAEEATPDFEYGYGEALRDRGVVRPVYFPRIDGRMEWTAPDGTFHDHTFEDALDPVRASQRLRTALSLDGDWLPSVLVRAHRELAELRRTDPAAGGLVIATDQEHARGIASMLATRCGVHAEVATSDDPLASDRIARFRDGSDPWIVAVRMVSEGVDIPRLRVGVFATTATTELFFRQAVGRLVRWTPGTGRQPSFMFIPDDARLRAHAFQIAEQRRHSLRREERTVVRAEAEEQPSGDDDGEQLTLFQPISAVAIGDVGAEWGAAVDAGEEGDVPLVEVDLPPPPPLAPVASERPGSTRREQKKELREANAAAARELARLTGREHRVVNAELNRLAGVSRVTEATLEQLERRLRVAERLLRRGA